jgi:hypothetical protein
MGINWVGVAAWGLTGDALRLWVLFWVLADPGGLSVAGAVRAAGAGLDLRVGRKRKPSFIERGRGPPRSGGRVRGFTVGRVRASEHGQFGDGLVAGRSTDSLGE